jgi:hypothetical protein
MSIINSCLSAVSGVLNGIAPLAMCIPGMQFLTVPALVANVLKGLSDSPPNWKGIITNLLVGAIPMGLGKALAAFKSGTSMQFAKIFGEKMSETIGEVAKKVGNPQISHMVGQLQTKLTSPEFHFQFANIVNKATGTRPNAILTSDQIGKAITPIAFQAQGLLNPVASVLAYPMEKARSMYYDGVVRNATKLPPPVSGDPVVSNAPTMRVVPGYRG